MRYRGKLAAIGVSVALAVASGCGGGSDPSSVETVTTTSVETAAPTELQGAKSFIRDHYTAVNRGRFEAAFADFSPALQDEFGPLSEFKDGYRFTEGTQVKSLDVLERSPDRALVAIELYADAIDACDNHIAQTFAGTLDVDLSGGTPELADAQVDWTGGEPAVEDSSECPEPPKPFHLSDGGGAGDGTGGGAPFCSTHDCIPNFDNGNGSRVQCVDGTWSQSGGIQGACSWHGGVR